MKHWRSVLCAANLVFTVVIGALFSSSLFVVGMGVLGWLAAASYAAEWIEAKR